MDIKNVTVAGGGVLGAQIGYQAAFSGYNVTFWGRRDDSIDRMKVKIKRLHDIYVKELEAAPKYIGEENPNYPKSFFKNKEDITYEKIESLKKANEKAFEDIKYTTNLKEAVENADVIIESIAEIKEEKDEFFKKISKLVNNDVLILSNSSTMIPSMFKDSISNNKRYLHLHFANNIWRQNLAEVMGHDETSKDAVEKTVEFAKSIGMQPVRVEKEQPGYLLNSLLIPFLDAAVALYGNDVADPVDIDKAWKIGTGAPRGPFEIIDVIGLTTLYNINKAKPEAIDPNSPTYKALKKIEKRMEEGKLGIQSGEGFYKYS